MEDEASESKKVERHGQQRPSTTQANFKDNPGSGRPESRGEASNKSKPNKPKLVPLEQIPAAREMLLAVLHAPPAEVHAMSERLRKDYPGRTPGEVRDAFRRVRDQRGPWKGKHATLSEEEIAILRS